MSFKVKNRKKKVIDNRTTIDAKHNNYLKQFKEKKKNLPLKKKELKNLKNELSKLNQIPIRELDDQQFLLKDD